jgi:hypothetical protein
VPDEVDRTSADDSLEPPSAGDVDESVAESTQTTGSRRWYVAAFGITVALVIIVLGLLPSALVRQSTVSTTCLPARRLMSTRPLAPTRRSSTSP